VASGGGALWPDRHVELDIRVEFGERSRMIASGDSVEYAPDDLHVLKRHRVRLSRDELPLSRRREHQSLPSGRPSLPARRRRPAVGVEHARIAN
jgi:hypothetical protein